MDLLNISSAVQSIAEAIESVLKVDVTIIDRKLNRVAATGLYTDRIGNTVGSETAMAYALENKVEIFLDNPREHEACSRCSKKSNCIELAEVCSPIAVAGRIYGVIGLVAFDDNQKNSIIANKDSLMGFLKKMGELIVSKLLEAKREEELLILAKELQVIINSIDGGIISLSNDSSIQHYNSKILKLLRIEGGIGHNAVQNIEHFLRTIGVYELIELEKEAKNKRFSYDQGRISGFFSITKIIREDSIVGWVLVFNRMKEVLKVVNEVIGNFKDINFDDIEGQSLEINQVKALALRASLSCSTVLIQGESGTGKELFAKAIHHNSQRSNGPFVAINCAAIPEQLLESELFGYEDGAFTGAKKGGCIGKFELANNGTIFLDEIGDMPTHLQTKLLRVLQGDYITRVGGKEEVKIDVRIIAATNKDLEALIEQGKFRDDLYYRINVIPLYIPPLRARKDDVVLIATYFLNKFNIKLNKTILGFDNKVRASLMGYNWPGNVRELANVIEYCVNMTNEDIITIDDLPKRLRKSAVDNPSYCFCEDIVPIKELEKKEILKAIKKYGRSKEGLTKAAEDLGIGIATMYRKLKLYDI